MFLSLFCSFSTLCSVVHYAHDVMYMEIHVHSTLAMAEVGKKEMYGI